jgi:hemerythrin-like domain-containing protein
MLRDKNLVPLSHQHQHALALCVRIHRAIESGDTGLQRWQREIRDAFDSEIEFHFQAEEQLLFPVAARYEPMRQLVSELIAEHTVLRSYYLAALAMSMGPRELTDFAATLSSHVRKEENELFQKCQELLSLDELETLGPATLAFFREHNVPLEPSSSALG